jgi:nicotinate-nucleotide--dimethylbenzimidazole phosphoribosyltransferase
MNTNATSGQKAPTQKIDPAAFAQQVRNKMDRKTKPPGSLGRLEQLAIRLAEIQQDLNPKLARKRICVYAGSHGVTAEGVSAYPTVVTSQMVFNFISGGAAINVLTRHAGIEVHVIDAGVDAVWPDDLLKEPRFYNRKVRAGTRNFLQEPAMTRQECEAALEVGREQVRLAVADGIQIIGIGEMGIGNTSAASALIVALLNFTAEEAVGRGTGVNDEALVNKVRVISEAVRKHGERAGKPRGEYWLRCVGGYEIAAMTGTILEAASQRLPVVIDGFISTAAAAVAFEMQPEAREVCFFSHRSDEQAHGKTLAALAAEPLFDLGMRLGEGTGAALAMPVLEASAKILCEMATFDSAGISEA